MTKLAHPLPNRIIDAHLHVASTHYLPKEFIDGVVANTARALEANLGLKQSIHQLYSMYESQLQDHDCHQLLQQMDDARIDQAVLLLPDYTYALKGAELTIEEMYHRHHQILIKHPDRFYVFGGVDPRWGEDGFKLFLRGIEEYGFKGLKIYPPCGYSPSDEKLFPYYEICQHFHLPVLMHVGGTSPALQLEYASPMLVESAARKFPNVNFILAHGSTGFTEECVMLCASRPNIYLDISTFQKQPVANLYRVFAKGINHKIIFGTDWPIFRMKGEQKAQLNSLFDQTSPVTALTERETALFFHGTIEYLMALTNLPDRQR
jgi:uncharacterized protein